MNRLLISILFASLLVGCQSPEHAAYVATTSVIQTADAAIGAFDRWIQENPVDIEDVRRVRKVALEFQAARDIARAAQRTAFQNKDGIGKEPAEQQALAGIDSAEKAALAVTQLIRSIAPALSTFAK
jgi:hypothetical protein